ncbi:protein amnionless isoform X2 [Struthio camelus]|uniref:protein amnionless isoform X2 n=1 Tax=Struthio camelus TaxID=8801 RepID=UPI0036041D80
MKSLFFLLLFLQLLAAAVAVYKQWLPNTNFETASNWDKDRVPCASDVIHFERDKVISVLVKSGHSVTDMYLPLNGELILASGAGFAAFDSSWDPGCDSGSAARFRDADRFAWFDPALWQTTSSPGELQQGARIFAVDEERVPCQYDDVIFQPETSFRTLASAAALAEYLRGPSAPLQFHGNGTFQVSGAGCPDKSGCVCGNAQDRHRICAALLGAAGRPCPAPACRSPLRALGHCCGVCGAIVCLEFTPDFDLQKYQDRLVQAFLSLPKYAGVQMAISKVHKPQTFLGITLRSSTPVIQIVLIDDRNGSQTGTAAEQLAADIMGDIAQHGEALGISRGKMEVASGSIFSGQAGISTSSKILTGTVLGLLFSLLLLGAALFLYRKGTPSIFSSMPRRRSTSAAEAALTGTPGRRGAQMGDLQTSLPRLWAVRLPRPWGGAQGPASPEPATDKGFDNPMFDVPLDTAEPPGAGSGEDTPQQRALKDNQVFYLNPLYDERETDA